LPISRGRTYSELLEGNQFSLGSIRFETLHTPGHSPEHISFLVYDETRSADIPLLMLSGDFLLVGSVGRPDIPGEDKAEEYAREMYRSIRQKLAGLPDGLEIYPAHGAGSLCGSGMMDRKLSTLGYERGANPYLDADLTEAGFLKMLLGSLPSRPDYYLRMKALNSEGPPLLHGLPGLNTVDVDRFRAMARDGHVVIDLRKQIDFGAAHVPGAIGLGAGPLLTMWAPWVVPYHLPTLLVAHDPRHAELAVRALVRVGLDNVEGYLDGGWESWYRSGYPFSSIPQIDARDADRLLREGRLRILDVRSEEEWKKDPIPGSAHLPCVNLLEQMHRFGDKAESIALICGTGYVSTLAASLMEQAGFQNLHHIPGGMEGWRNQGLPVGRFKEGRQSIDRFTETGS
jgi:hydroxyacylglutathione hydrolase